MGLTARYRSPAGLPATIPIFPLGGALLLPRGQLPLNIFEPRYLTMIDHALSNERIIGMVQPDSEAGLAQERDPGAKPDIYAIGCAGRITSYAETNDNRLFITLTGLCRFRIGHELDAATPYRQATVSYDEFAGDLKPGSGADEIDRDRLLEVLKAYLSAHNLQADWDAIRASSNESLVNSLSMISPYGPAEKQALLEAKTLDERNQLLIALTEIALVQSTETDPTVQ